MQTRLLGSSGLQVPLIALGAGHLGDSNRSDSEVELLLDRALELGVTLVDTAPSYGASEERLGRWAGARRGRVLLSTKCGYGVPGVEDWTGPCITQGVELALRRLRTDVIDVLHFHSCPVEVLERPGVVDALTRAVDAGKVRVAAYSGDNAALEHAIGSGRFGAVQVSVNLFDQRAIERGVRWARERGMGVIAKRPLGNAPWRFSERPHAGDIALYWERMKRMELDARGLDWSELALRFAAFVPGVSTCIVGTSRVENLQRNLRALEKGPLPDDVASSIREAFQRHDAGWDGQI